MLIATSSLVAVAAAGASRSAFAETVTKELKPESMSTDSLIKGAIDAYVYFYPLVVFGVSFEVLTNVEKPTWRRLSAPVNQFMSVRENDPANHGVILPSTDTLYTLSWVDVTKEPVVFSTPAIPDIPRTRANGS
jgi:hypothetical protein